MLPRARSVLILLTALLLFGTGGHAQVAIWQMGGSGLAWSGNDTSQTLIEFAQGAIRPVFITPEQNIFLLLHGWGPLKFPRELDYIYGETPRSWKGDRGNATTAHNGTYLVDGDSTTFNPPVSSNPEWVWYTLDMGVPVPANRFGFFTPPRGFLSDGRPFSEDAVPAFEVSIAPEGDPAWLEKDPYQRLGTVIADVHENFATRVQIDFPRQYVRYVRYKRNTSLLDEGQSTTQGAGAAYKGTIADFELFGEGVPRRAIYRSRIFDLGAPFNFGRLFWSATLLRMVDGRLQEAPEAEVGIGIEVRSGRDEDPNVYHEYTDRGGEQVVTRQLYEEVLQPRLLQGIYEREPRPGMRASVTYDSENWSFWSTSFSQPGQPLGLKGGSHLQLRVVLESEEFDAFVQLDSLWIETGPLLASRVMGEVARADEPQPARGFVQVELGRTTEFVYDFRPFFEGGQGAGFDAVRIRTGGQVEFRGLEMGTPPARVEPERIVAGEEELVIFLPERVAPRSDAPVRVFFAGEVFALAWTFTGEVFDSAQETLPQLIEAGDATERISTSSLRVLGASETAGDLVQSLEISTGVLTPNGDGVNDQVEIRYALFRLPEAIPVTLKVYALDGRRVAVRSLGLQRSGLRRVLWDGRNSDGELLPPGLYLIEVSLESEATAGRRLRSLGIAY